MRQAVIFSAMSAVLLCGPAAVAQEDGDRARRLAEELRDAYQNAYNAHDAEAAAALYREDADVVYPDGTAVRGREQIQKELEQIFSSNENTRIALSPQSARFITRRILLVDGVTEITDGPTQLPRRTRHAVIFQREQQGDQWRIAALRIIVPVEQRE